jgi:hypothetical protein
MDIMEIITLIVGFFAFFCYYFVTL